MFSVDRIQANLKREWIRKAACILDAGTRLKMLKYIVAMI